MDELIARNSAVAAQAVPLAKALAEVYFLDRYPGFDLDDPDWPALRLRLQEVSELLEAVKARVTAKT